MTAPRCWTGAELVATQHLEPIYVVEGLLPVGLTILGGRPKSGKSRAALDLAVSVALGRPFLGRPCGRGKAVYFALEDGPRRLARRLQALGGPPAENLLVYFEPDDDLVAAIGQHFEDGAALVVVDTVGRAWQFDHNDTDQVYTVFAPLQSVATQYERGLLVVDHLRKSRGEVAGVEDVSGSVGKAASADNLWLLNRQPRSKSAVLDIVSRDLDEDLSLALEPGDGGAWRCAGNADTLRRTEGRQKVLSACGQVVAAGDAITVTAVALASGCDRGHVSRTLGDLVEMGDLVRLPKVGKLQPFALTNAVNRANQVNDGEDPPRSPLS